MRWEINSNPLVIHSVPRFTSFITSNSSSFLLFFSFSFYKAFSVGFSLVFILSCFFALFNFLFFFGFRVLCRSSNWSAILTPNSLPIHAVLGSSWSAWQVVYSKQIFLWRHHTIKNSLSIPHFRLFFFVFSIYNRPVPTSKCGWVRSPLGGYQP